jgi:hypothetical protein
MNPVYLPELDHANQERTYIKVSHDGSSCIMEPHEAMALMRDAPGVYTSEEVQMSASQFDRLPDFSGW